MEAVTSSSPPAGAPTFAVVVWIRPDVHEPPDPSAVMLRLPLPSRWTLADELVIVSISPVPKLEPGPVSYFQADDGPLPAAPLKSSPKTVDQPDGAGGTALGAAALVWATAAAWRAGAWRAATLPAALAEVRAAWAAGAAADTGAMIATLTAASAASRRRLRCHQAARGSAARPGDRFPVIVLPPRSQAPRPN